MGIFEIFAANTKVEACCQLGEFERGFATFQYCQLGGCSRARQRPGGQVGRGKGDWLRFSALGVLIGGAVQPLRDRHQRGVLEGLVVVLPHGLRCRDPLELPAG